MGRCSADGVLVGFQQRDSLRLGVVSTLLQRHAWNSRPSCRRIHPTTEEVSVEGSALIPCDVDKGPSVRTDHVPEVYSVLAVVYYCKSVITQILSLPGHL